MSVLTGITGAVQAQIAGRLNSAVSGALRSGIGSLTGAARGAATSALGPIDKTGKYTTAMYAYPSNVGSDTQGHYIIFNVNEFTPGKIHTKQTKKSYTEIFNKIMADGQGYVGPKEASLMAKNQIADADKITKDIPAAPPAAKGGSGRSINADKPKVRMPASISLYMPPSVQVSYEVKYADQEIGTLAMLGSAAIEAFKNANGNMKAKLTAVKNKLGTGATEGVTNLLNASLDTLAPGAKALQQINSGKVITPRMEMMFEGVGRRSFSYTFNFIPKSADEAKTIQEIIYTFKENMMPSYSNASTRREMNIPNTFDITYMYQNQVNGFINKISTCFLQKVDVQYGGDRFTAYDPIPGKFGGGPPPQKSQITLDFVEMETLSKDMIKEGY